MFTSVFNLFIFLWLCWAFPGYMAFLSSVRGLAILQLWWVGFSLWCPLFLWSMGSRAPGLQQLQYVSSVVTAGGLESAGSIAVAHRLICFMARGIFSHQGSNHVLCIGRRILNHWTCREVPNILLTEQLYLVWPLRQDWV